MEPNIVQSPDGTQITYERSGHGPTVIVIGGALNDRASQQQIAAALAGPCTVVRYDRRHRGASTDVTGGRGLSDERVQREIDDLRALMQALGGPASVFGFSSGAALALHAAAALPVERLALWEAPYQQDPGAPERQRAYTERLEALVAGGRWGDAAEHFMTLAGTPDAMIAQFRVAPWWSTVEALAPSLVYDAAVMGDGQIPVEVAARVQAPTLVLAGGASGPWMRESAEALVAALPDARLAILDGQSHTVDAEAIVPRLVSFFAP